MTRPTGSITDDLPKLHCKWLDTHEHTAVDEIDYHIRNGDPVSFDGSQSDALGTGEGRMKDFEVKASLREALADIE